MTAEKDIWARGVWTDLSRWTKAVQTYMGSPTRTPPRPGWPGQTPCLVPAPPAAETKTKLPTRPHSRRGQLTAWWQVGHIGPLPSPRGQHFSLTGIHPCSVDLPFPHITRLPKLPSVDLRNATSTVMVLHMAPLLIKKLTSQRSVVVPHSNDAHGSYRVLHCPDADGSTPTGKGPLKAVIAPIRG